MRLRPISDSGLPLRFRLKQGGRLNVASSGKWQIHCGALMRTGAVTAEVLISRYAAQPILSLLFLEQ